VAASFMVEVQKAVDQILEYPESAPVILGGVRGKVILRFPYSLMYRVVDDVVIILAVAHQRQRPEFWIDREP
jgi:plasmid stabilization system protein ParE